MNSKYLNAVYTNLILKRDYEPLRTGDGLIILGEDVKVLQKYDNGVNFIVELIDGDRLSAAAIGGKLAATHDMLRKADPGHIIHFIEVLVFNDAAEAEKKAVIAAACGHQDYVRKYLSFFTVNLAGFEIACLNGSGLPADGVDKLLKQFLYSPNDEYEAIPDLNRIMALKKKEYTIEFKAKKPTVTYYLIGINIAVWILVFYFALINQVIFDQILSLGWKDNLAIIGGQYWRLLTPMFLHAGPDLGIVSLHLLVNCYSLYVLGQIIERIYGHNKFLTIYLVAGIIGNIASFAFSPRPAVGASGAIFGIFGALLYYGLENPKVFKKYFGYNVIVTIVLNAVIGFSLAGLVDNFAHLGGLAGGFLTAGIVRVKADPRQFPGRYLFLAATLLLVALGLYYGFQHWAPPHFNITWVW